MASLYCNRNQAKLYSLSRPTYPPELFHFIASKVPVRRLAWDVGTGSGQAAAPLSALFDSVVATDSSPAQLSYAPAHLHNVRFVLTPPSLPLADLHRLVAPPGSVDLITVATALHWLDIPAFYAQARAVLRHGRGVVAVWCYTSMVFESRRVDEIYQRVLESTWPYWDEVRGMVEEGYEGIEFPFEAVEGVDEGTAPVRRFAAERGMEVEDLVVFVRSMASYRRAREAGVELLTEEVVEELERAWCEDGKEVKNVRFPISLRMGRV